MHLHLQQTAASIAGLPTAKTADHEAVSVAAEQNPCKTNDATIDETFQYSFCFFFVCVFVCFLVDITTREANCSQWST
jgi:hypothetical protein